MFLRHVGICACFAGEEGQKTLGPFSNLKVFFFQGLEDTFSCVLLLKAYSTSLLLAVCSCHSKHTHTSAADTSERLRLSPVSVWSTLTLFPSKWTRDIAVSCPEGNKQWKCWTFVNVHKIKEDDESLLKGGWEGEHCGDKPWGKSAYQWSYTTAW